MSDSLGIRAFPTCMPASGRAEDALFETEFVEMYDAAFPRVYSFVRSQVESVQIAQELVGQVFLKAYRHWLRAPHGDAAVFWLFKIARTTVIDYWRTEGRRDSVNVSLEELDLVSDSTNSPEAIYSMKERWTLLLRVISMMDDDDRILLGLRFAAERTNREIAAVLSLSEAAVSMRLLRTLRRLRVLLKELGVS